MIIQSTAQQRDIIRTKLKYNECMNELVDKFNKNTQKETQTQQKKITTVIENKQIYNIPLKPSSPLTKTTTTLTPTNQNINNKTKLIAKIALSIILGAGFIAAAVFTFGIVPIVGSLFLKTLLISAGINLLIYSSFPSIFLLKKEIFNSFNVSGLFNSRYVSKENIIKEPVTTFFCSLFMPILGDISVMISYGCYQLITLLTAPGCCIGAVGLATFCLAGVLLGVAGAIAAFIGTYAVLSA